MSEIEGISGLIADIVKWALMTLSGHVVHDEPAYGWFTEGFDTLDLKEAEASLDALA
jgi:hypothetical protein